MDMTYRGFLRVGTTFDIFHNILLLYIEYGVWSSPGYGVLDFVSSRFLVKCRHIYTISSLMDTAYRMSEIPKGNDVLLLLLDYYPPENKTFVACYAEFIENSLISQETSGSTVDFDEIQREDAQPSKNTSEHQPEAEHDDVEPQTDVNLVHGSARIPQAPERYGFIWVPPNVEIFQMQPNVDLSKTQGPFIPAEVKRMKGVPYASAIGSIMYATGYVFVMNECTVDWKSSKQSTTMMCSKKGEYIAASEATLEAIWIRKFIFGLGVVLNNDRPMDMYCDNTGSTSIADEPGVQKGAKHFR
uniref:Retrovirus-related Pol polyprotein from transposon TNT 1-94 n=1 Tax=Tanacetum cinerariifolium TaxID=118510 RepID=A0A6L2L5X6_TANCI|nr:hypothetical protein [Tanacetum cinerariifolium]